MAEGYYRYTGHDRRGYLAYIDDDTNQLLIAEPGGEYRMRPVNQGDAVPPNDGLWDEASVDETSDTEVEVGTENETEDEK